MAHGRLSSDPVSSSSGTQSSYAAALTPTNLPASMRAFASSVSNVASSSQMLADLTPQLLQHRLLLTTAGHPSAQQLASSSRSLTKSVGSFARRLPTAYDSAPATSVSFAIKEKIDSLLALPVASYDESAPPSESEGVSLLQGFRATEPASNAARQKRRRRRTGLSEGLDLRDGDPGSRLIRDVAHASPDRPGGRRNSAPSLVTPTKKGRKRSSGSSLSNSTSALMPELTREELEQEVVEILQDQAHIETRKSVLSAEIAEVDRKMAALEAVRQDLRRSLLGLREDRLSLDDELEGARERLHQLEALTKGRSVSATSSRRRKGPSFLPSEHDELPVGVSFLSLSGHLDAITALDFTEPYGTLVSASNDESLRLWDLSTGEGLGFLRGHLGPVKCLQVEGSLCISGAKDGVIRLWDLERAEEDAVMSQSAPPIGGLAALKEEEDDADGLMSGDRGDSACIKALTGHASAVTACYFEDNCLVTGSADKTLRQWDLITGQCVMTMDILWAISNPVSQPLAASPPERPLVNPRSPPTDSYFDLPIAAPPPKATTPRRTSLATLRRLSSQPFGLNSPDPFTLNPRTSLSALEDFHSADYAVGGVMHWGYALASGSADGCVRMWDMRTGQAHRTLVGHVAPVTCLQFDEFHLVSGSLDKSIRIWDLRTGAIADTLRYDQPVTALQFDTRKIVAAAGDAGVKLFNRTTLQHSTLTTGGHTNAVTKLRFMDRFLASGGRDSTIRLWSIA